jgi:hypothetical protein
MACSLNTSRIGRASPEAALLISCFMAACSFVIVRRSPFSLMTRCRFAGRAGRSSRRLSAVLSGFPFGPS